MRVALVCPYSVSIPGGVQGQVLGLASALAGLGEEVLLVAPYDGGNLPGVPFVDAGSSRGLPANRSRAPVGLDLAATRRALHELERFGPEALHLHEPFVPALSLGALLGTRVPALGTFHRSGSGIAYRALGLVARRWFRRLAAATAVSGSARATLVKVVGKVAAGCEIVPNGVELDRFERARGWPTSGPTAVFVGRHERRKGLEVLLSAFSGLRVPARLWVIGTGPETGTLRARHGGDARIEWCGRVGDAELAERLVGADVLVAPALGGESFGMVLLEAMAAGTAVIASDIDGYREAAGPAARLVRAGDVEGLRGALAELLTDAPSRAALVAAGRARASELSMRRLAERYAAGYRALATTARGGPG